MYKMLERKKALIKRFTSECVENCFRFHDHIHLVTNVRYTLFF